MNVCNSIQNALLKSSYFWSCCSKNQSCNVCVLTTTYTNFWLYCRLNPSMATNFTSKCQVAHRDPKGKNTPKKATCNRLADLATWSDFSLFHDSSWCRGLKPTNREADSTASKSPKMAKPGKRQCSLEIQKHKSIRKVSPTQHRTQ